MTSSGEVNKKSNVSVYIIFYIYIYIYRCDDDDNNNNNNNNNNNQSLIHAMHGKAIEYEILKTFHIYQNTNFLYEKIDNDI